jgi:uncharacterized OB-fold protein
MSGQQETNVVRLWRRRENTLGRQGWKCLGCGRLALVRRRACAACGSAKGFENAPLPARGKVAALTSAGMSVEHLDQTTPRKPSVLLDLGGGTRLACLLASVDSGDVMDHLRGADLRLAVRRIPLGHLSPDEPIPYGLKAAADLKTRASIKAAHKPAAPVPPAANDKKE